MNQKGIIAPAKLNIGLYVERTVNKNKSGLHNLITIMTQFFLFHDIIDITVTPDSSCSRYSKDKSEIVIKGLENICPPEKSTIYKALTNYMEAANINMKTEVSVKKSIPLCSGMGGGSSDAGIILRILNNMLGNPMSEEQMMSTGLKTGSDVCFFIKNHPTAVVSSTGEKVTPIKSRDDLYFRFIRPDREKISTESAFMLLDRSGKSTVIPHSGELIEMYYKDVADWEFKNSFSFLYETPIIPTDENEKILLTGSGPTFFIVGQKCTDKHKQ